MTLRERPLMLVVDDDTALRLMMHATLQQAGFDVEEAGNCAEGLVAFERLRPDLVLLDVMMPDGDGFGVCRRIRDYDYGRDVPVVMVTGLDDTDSINRAYQSGATDFITKPINWAVVGHRIRYILRASHAMTDLKFSERRNRALLAAMPDLILRLDRDGRCMDYQLGSNNPWEAVLGSDPHAGLSRVLPEEQHAAVEAAVRAALRERGVQTLEFAAGGAADLLHLELRFTALDETEVLAIVRDISARKRVESTLRQWATVFESSADAIVVADAERRLLTVNRACLAMTGYDEAQLIGQSTALLFDGDEAFSESQRASLAEDGYWQGETWTRRRDGECFPTFTALTAVRSGDEVVNYILILSDITEKKAAEARIEYLAHRDVVTGLPNRSLFNYRVGIALAHARRTQTRLAVMFIDLDRFKNINESLGHGFGDRLLKIVAERLETSMREGDTVSRLGGDEFAMLLAEIDEDTAIAQAERVLNRIAQPYTLDGKVLQLSASIGISLFPGDGDDVETLVKNADAAMYLAKESGRNTYQFFLPELNKRALDRLNTESLLRNAIDRGELELHYQPQISVDGGIVVGCEALIRWRSPELGMVSPDRFIPLAEETGLILPIGEWIVATACAQIHAWQEAGLPRFPVAVNISAVQFEQRNFVRNLCEQVARSGVEPRWLELELTERMVMRDIEGVIGSLRELKEGGFTLSVDDFGTGYSSMSYLRRLPIDVLKIDQSFVRGMHGDRTSLAIVEAIVTLAKALGLRSIAEGVETEAELSHLRRLRCEYAQGYHFARPLPAAEMAPWLTAWNARRDKPHS